MEKILSEDCKTKHGMMCRNSFYANVSAAFLRINNYLNLFVICKMLVLFVLITQIWIQFSLSLHKISLPLTVSNSFFLLQQLGFHLVGCMWGCTLKVQMCRECAVIALMDKTNRQPPIKSSSPPTWRSQDATQRQKCHVSKF